MFRHGLSQIFQPLKIGIVGAPFNLGQIKTGVSEGPAVLRNTGFIQRLEELGHDVIDAGDVQPDEKVIAEAGPAGEKNHTSVFHYNMKLADTVQRIRSDDRLCITLGGDHSLGIGSVAGHGQGTPFKQALCEGGPLGTKEQTQVRAIEWADIVLAADLKPSKLERKLVVLWVDAHADINTGRTSETGNMHGMSVAFLLKEMRNKVNRLPGSEWPQPSFEAKHLAYLGLRDVDVLEQKFLDDLGILNFGMKEIDQLGLPEAIARCLDQLQPTENRSLHVSFDIDALDPTEAPSTGTPVRGGLTLREGLSIVEAAQSTGRLRGFDLVEVNPTLGRLKEGIRTAEAAKSIILAAAGGVRS